MIPLPQKSSRQATKEAPEPSGASNTSHKQRMANSQIAAGAVAATAPLKGVRLFLGTAPDPVVAGIFEYLPKDCTGHLEALASLSQRHRAIADRQVVSLAVTAADFDSFIRKYSTGDYHRLESITMPQSIEQAQLSQFLELAAHAPHPLKELNLEGCIRLAAVPDKLPCGLKVLDLSSCYGIRRLPSNLPESLEVLDLTDCTLIETLPSLPANLKELRLSGLFRLVALPLPSPPALIELDVSHCAALRHLPADLPDELEILNVHGCPHLPTAREHLPQALIISR